MFPTDSTGLSLEDLVRQSTHTANPIEPNMFPAGYMERNTLLSNHVKPDLSLEDLVKLKTFPLDTKRHPTYPTESIDELCRKNHTTVNNSVFLRNMDKSFKSGYKYEAPPTQDEADRILDETFKRFLQHTGIIEELTKSYYTTTEIIDNEETTRP